MANACRCTLDKMATVNSATASTIERKAPLVSNFLLLFMLAMILANLGGNMYGPLMSLYVRELGATVGQIGLFFTLASIIPLGLQIFGGWISDTIGRLRAIAIGSLFGVLAYLPLILAHRWEWLLAAEALGAMTRALIAPSFDAFIAEQSSEENRAKLFGITQTLFGVVGVLGPILGGYLAEQYGFKPMLVVAALFYILATILRVGMARQAASHTPVKQALTLATLKANLTTMFGLLVSGGILTWIFITDGVRDISFALSMNLFSVYMQDYIGLSLTQIGITSTIFGACAMAMHIPGGFLADKAGERLGIALGFALVGTSLGLLVFVPSGAAWLSYVGWALAGIGVGLMSPAYAALISKAVPDNVRGTAFGLLSTSLGLFSLPAPWIGGWLWEHVHPRFPFLITVVVTFLSIFPIWLKFKLPQNGKGTTPSDNTAQN